MSAEMTGRDHALAATAQGFKVFPCKAGEKTPAVFDDWEGRATTTTPATIERWSIHTNYGVACGPSGLVVIDCDLPKNGETPPSGIHTGLDAFCRAAGEAGGQVEWDTLVVRTASGGHHLYYRADPTIDIRNARTAMPWRVDVRGNGGYVVGPGSVIGGVPYATIYDEPIAPLPAWLREALTPRPPQPSRRPGPHAGNAQTRYTYAALRACTLRVLEAQEGTRNEALNRESFGAAKAGVDPDLVRRVMRRAAHHIGLPDREAERTIASALSGVPA